MSWRACGLGCGAWLLLLALPLLALWLAVRREVAWTRGPAGLEQDRVFYLAEPAAGGLGYLAARVVRDDPAAGGPLCVRTRVTYWLWRSAEAGDPNTEYCQCYTRAAGGLELAADPCPGE